MPGRSIPRWAFHPLFVLGVAICAALVYAYWIHETVPDPRRVYLLYYFVPIGVPFVAFLFDRAERWPEWSEAHWAIEVPVIVVALLRTQVRVPLTSGHALFLAFALGTVRSRVAWWSAAAVMAEVIVLKLAWQDGSLFGGIAVGTAAAWAARRVAAQQATRVPRAGTSWLAAPVSPSDGSSLAGAGAETPTAG